MVTRKPKLAVVESSSPTNPPASPPTLWRRAARVLPPYVLAVPSVASAAHKRCYAPFNL